MNSSSDPFWWRIFLHEVQIISPPSKSTAATSTLGSQAKSKMTMEATSAATADSAVTDTTNLIKRALYDGNTVGLTPLPEPYHRVSNNIGKNLFPVKRLLHNNLQKFYGIAVDDENLCVFTVGEFCHKGTLTRVLERARMDLDWNFKCSLIKDCAAGMTYLHGSSLVSHGNLSSHTCLVDSNFVLKISDCGMEYFRRDEDMRPLIDEDEERDVSQLFWRPPELLRTTMPPEGTQVKNDVIFSSDVAIFRTRFPERRCVRLR
ncbi:hypothetical protein RvY_13081-2 [Ramazzottius varieornatus]|nr:hypothetical protein RvY_13081-2 [Ramazzottius varieornatus]